MPMKQFLELSDWTMHQFATIPICMKSSPAKFKLPSSLCSVGWTVRVPHDRCGFPMTGVFRSLHIRNKLPEGHQRPMPGSLIKTWDSCFSRHLLHFPSPIVEASRAGTTNAPRLWRRAGIWSMHRELTAVDFWCAQNVSLTQQSNLGQETLHRILRVASKAVPQTHGC